MKYKLKYSLTCASKIMKKNNIDKQKLTNSFTQEKIRSNRQRIVLFEQQIHIFWNKN